MVVGGANAPDRAVFSAVENRRIFGGIIFVIRNILRWRDAPVDDGPPKTIYNRFIRWSRMGAFNRIFAGSAAKCGSPIN